MKKLGIVIFFAFIFMPASRARTPLIGKFNHQLHEEKVFQVNNISCTDCHNVAHEKGQELAITRELRDATFKKSIKQICHDCHGGAKYPLAEKSCLFCHDTKERLLQIKPLNHQNLTFKERHGPEARSFGGQCLNCHTNTQCVKCHSSRNEVINQNHSRNYKYYHGIEARLSPQRCDACHTQTYCIRCHVGAK